MAFNLKWAKIRLDPTSRSLIDRAVTDLNRKLATKLRLIKLASGKMFACRVEDLWFCRVGDDGQPPQILTLVIDIRPEQRTLLPLDNPDDFAECCDLLNFRTVDEQGRFRDFLLPSSDQTGPPSLSGAS